MPADSLDELDADTRNREADLGELPGEPGTVWCVPWSSCVRLWRRRVKLVPWWHLTNATRSLAGVLGMRRAAVSRCRPSWIRVCDGDFTGLFAVYFAVEASNLAGYRAAFIAGAPKSCRTLINSRKHAGMIVPAPVQAAMMVALADEAHVAAQKDLYRARREVLEEAITAAGGRIEDS